MVTLSASLRDLILDAYDVAFPAGAKLELLGQDGVVLVTFDLLEQTWAPAINGIKKLREPLTAYALASGVVRSYRLRVACT